MYTRYHLSYIENRNETQYGFITEFTTRDIRKKRCFGMNSVDIILCRG